jgi:hypothetical protein
LLQGMSPFMALLGLPARERGHRQQIAKSAALTVATECADC